MQPTSLSSSNHTHDLHPAARAKRALRLSPMKWRREWVWQYAQRLYTSTAATRLNKSRVCCNWHSDCSWSKCGKCGRMCSSSHTAANRTWVEAEESSSRRIECCNKQCGGLASGCRDGRKNNTAHRIQILHLSLVDVPVPGTFAAPQRILLALFGGRIPILHSKVQACSI